MVRTLAQAMKGPFQRTGTTWPSAADKTLHLSFFKKFFSNNSLEHFNIENIYTWKYAYCITYDYILSLYCVTYDNCGEIDEKENAGMLMRKTFNKMMVMVGEHVATIIGNVRSICLVAEAQQMNTTLLMTLTKNSNLRFDETTGCYIGCYNSTLCTEKIRPFNT
uniref:Uncharacterized protein n=1 Tax=Glossina austeni TaxID=7395 RepID=A0A1A9UNQ8_GLOAU